MINFFSNSFVNCFYEIQSIQVTVSWDIVCVVDANCQIFGHLPILNAFDSCSFKAMTELLELWNIIELSSVKKSSRPSKNTGN